jgi:hypothetical protein
MVLDEEKKGDRCAPFGDQSFKGTCESGGPRTNQKEGG